MRSQSVNEKESLQLSLSAAERDMLRMWLPEHIASLETSVKVDEAWQIWRSQLDAARALLQKIA